MSATREYIESLLLQTSGADRIAKDTSDKEIAKETSMFAWATNIEHDGVRLEWTNLMARARFALLKHLTTLPELNLRGKPTILVDPSPNGAAYFRNALGFYEWRIYGGSEDAYLHMNPGPHRDFLQGIIRYPLLNNPLKPTPDDWNRVATVSQLTESIVVYPLGHLGGACHFVGATVATLALAIELAKEKMSLTEARRAYGPGIVPLLEEQQLYDVQCDRQQDLVTDNITAFFPKTLEALTKVVRQSHLRSLNAGRRF